MPAVIVVAASASQRAALRARVTAAGVAVLAEAPDVPAALSSRADVLVVSGEDLIERALAAAGDDGALGVVGLVAGADAAARLAPDADVAGWALLADDASGAELRAAIAAAAAGLGAWPASWSARVARADDVDPADLDVGRLQDEGGVVPGQALTRREQDVLDLLAEGLSNRRIAELLDISEHTVKFHLAAIYGKLGVSGRAAAINRALKRGIIRI